MLSPVIRRDPAELRDSSKHLCRFRPVPHLAHCALVRHSLSDGGLILPPLTPTARLLHSSPLRVSHGANGNGPGSESPPEFQMRLLSACRILRALSSKLLLNFVDVSHFIVSSLRSLRPRRLSSSAALTARSGGIAAEAQRAAPRLTRLTFGHRALQKRGEKAEKRRNARLTSAATIGCVRIRKASKGDYILD